MDLPKILLTGLVFFVFFLVFLEFLDSWAWDSKNFEKHEINQKNQKKPILNGLTQDSSHRIGFVFVFFVVFGFSGLFFFGVFGLFGFSRGFCCPKPNVICIDLC